MDRLNTCEDDARGNERQSGEPDQIRGCYLHYSVLRRTAINGKPRSRTLPSRPCSAAWSTTGPLSSVGPSISWVTLSPSNQSAQRAWSCHWERLARFCATGPTRWDLSI